MLRIVCIFYRPCSLSMWYRHCFRVFVTAAERTSWQAIYSMSCLPMCFSTYRNMLPSFTGMARLQRFHFHVDTAKLHRPIGCLMYNKIRSYLGQVTGLPEAEC